MAISISEAQMIDELFDDNPMIINVIKTLAEMHGKIHAIKVMRNCFKSRSRLYNLRIIHAVVCLALDEEVQLRLHGPDILF